MNWFGGDDDHALRIAKIQSETMSDCFERIISSCTAKCVPKFHSADLAIGEIQCVDRCVSKYMNAQEVITKAVAAFEEKTLQQKAGGVNTGTARPGGGPPKF